MFCKESRTQRYGTQIEFVDGQARPIELVEPDNVDDLRKQVGLPPMAEYLQMVKKMYQGKAAAQTKKKGAPKKKGAAKKKGAPKKTGAAKK